MFGFSEFIDNNKDDMYTTLKELAVIPAPSGNEEKRAKYVLDFLKAIGAKDAYMDSMFNVILPINIEDSNEITVLAAHTDIVFGYDVPLNYKEENGKILCPGIGDDTTSVVVLMYTAKYIVENNIKPSKGLLIVLNSCEEGMGNLKGAKQLFKDFCGRIKEFVTYDSDFYSIASECVGSHRYRVTVKTEGGHSFGKFGKPNAISELSKIVSRIYRLKVPQTEGTKTTYNVGVIDGGTSVNTIAQSASMLCEYRSDSRQCLEIMNKKFMRIFRTAQTDKVTVEVEMVGERPCSNVDCTVQQELAQKCKSVCDKVYNVGTYFRSGSTDCNIPLSMGIPAVNVGVYIGGLSHTKEEWIEKDSVLRGLLFSLKLVKELCIVNG